MPVELLVILGAEASILGFVAAMTLYAKRMDVLSGRSFERPQRLRRREPACGAVAPSKGRRFTAVDEEVDDFITLVSPDFLRPTNRQNAATAPSS